MGRLSFALYEAEQVGLTAMEVRVLEVPGLSVLIASKDALLKMWNLVKAVHIKLPYERRKFLVLEPSS